MTQEEKSKIPIKLYTEKQIREAIAQGYDWCHQKYIPSDNMIDIFIKQLDAIHLPTDAEIDKQYFPFYNKLIRQGCIEGAYWMKYKIIYKMNEI